MKVTACGLAILMAFLQSGCSFFRSSMQDLHVMTPDGGAKVYVNGKYEGEDPVTANVPCDKDVGIIARKDGYKTATQKIGTKFSTTGVLDLIGGCFLLIPFLGLLAPGARELDTSSVTIQMERESPAGAVIQQLRPKD